jgi:hypothetical protein
MVTSQTNAGKNCRQQRNKFNRLDGRPEWIRTIDLFRVKNEVNHLNASSSLVFRAHRIPKEAEIT